MSVHGEYSRVLEIVLDRLRGLSPESREPWLSDFESARISVQPDLALAARASVATAKRLRCDETMRGHEGLADPLDALEAHCRAILG